MEEKSTGDLMIELMKMGSFENYMKQNKDVIVTASVADLLNQILERKGLSRARIAKDSGLNEIYAYQVMAGTRTPSRDKVLCICVAIGLTVEEIQGLLKMCGYASLYPKRKRDAIILFALKETKPVPVINEELFNQGEKTLC